MTRYLYGGVADYVLYADPADPDGLRPVRLKPGAVLRFYNALIGGDEYTSLQDGSGTDVSPGSIVADGTGGMPPTYGPDDVLLMYMSADGGPRRAIIPIDAASRLASSVASYTDEMAAIAGKLTGVGAITAGPTEPANPADGDVWLDTSQAVGADPVAFVAASGIDNPASSADTTCPLPAGIQPGHMMLLAVSADVSGGGFLQTPPAGWTELIPAANVGTGDTFAGFWWKVAVAGETAPLIRMNSARKATAAIVAYSGSATTPHVIGAAGTRADGSSVNTTTAPALTTTVPNCLVASLFIEKSGNAATITDPAGTTRRAARIPALGSSSPSVLIVDAAQDTAGATPARTATYLTAAAAAANSDNGRGLQVALRRVG
jgi:hypothetical protein